MLAYASLCLEIMATDASELRGEILRLQASCLLHDFVLLAYMWTPDVGEIR